MRKTYCVCVLRKDLPTHQTNTQYSIIRHDLRCPTFHASRFTFHFSLLPNIYFCYGQTHPRRIARHVQNIQATPIFRQVQPDGQGM